ncbi:RM38 protein, partial [Amia calva]|nr:RM38 protein [Amia calva]
AISAAVCRRAAPLGPMPNEDIDVTDLDSLKKYRSWTRYMKFAEEASGKPQWWKTYRQHVIQDDGAEKIDIGLPQFQLPRSQQLRKRKRVLRENHRDSELERESRLYRLRIPLDEVKADWERINGPYHCQRVAEHYGIYRDLFPGATFVPRVVLRVLYSPDGKSSAQVHCGNELTPTEAGSPPEVKFSAEEGSLWTLLLTSPDEHLRDNESEYVHWLVGNIPGNAVQSGEEVCHYLPPFPAKGTGFHRFIFVLFKQDGPVNFKDDYRPSPCHSLTMRTFRTVDFYRTHQDAITPAGLAFFQAQWDMSVTHTFHELLNMKEPIFEFDRPPVYHPPQKKYPHAQPLRYLERYRENHKPTYGIY